MSQERSGSNSRAFERPEIATPQPANGARARPPGLAGSAPESAFPLLVLLPQGEGRQPILDTLRREGIEHATCNSIDVLCGRIERGADAVLVDDSVIGPATLQSLRQVLMRQPAWSELPLIIITDGGGDCESARLVAALEDTTYAVLLERPVGPITLSSSIRAALKSRRRQYELREYLRRLEKTATELRQSEERFRLAVAAADVGTWHIDLRTNRETRDACLNRILGLRPEPSVTPIDDFGQWLHPQDRAISEVAWQRAIDEGQLYVMESRIIRPSGELRWIHDRGRVFRDSNGRPLYATGAVVDITDRKTFEHSLQEARRAADQANRAKSAFLANMSHEIRTPMTAVLGYVDILQDQVEGPAALESLETIRQNGRYLLDLIGDILDLSKIEAGALELYEQKISLVDFISDLKSLMEIRARHHQIDLVVEWATEVPVEVTTDPIRLRQILVNLIGNAIKFTESGEVRLRISMDRQACHTDQAQTCDEGGRDGCLWFRISDTGIGMTPEQMTRLFHPFSQGDASVTRRFGGTGLGLAISERLVDMLGGEVVVSSVPKQGSVFEFSISAGIDEDAAWIKPGECSVPGHAPPPRRDAPAQTDGAATRRRRLALARHVLVVDDGRAIRRLVQRFLETAGATVELLENGAEAVDRVLRHEGPDFDLVLLDMQMPVMDGYTAARRIRAGGYLGPIVALTANAMKGDRDRCIAAGCTDFLPKPIDRQQLIAMIQRLTS